MLGRSAAWVGLVPRQHSSGGKERLLGISKRGDVYLRTLLIHGARSVVRRVQAQADQGNGWLKALLKSAQQECGGGGARQQKRAHRLGAAG